MKKFFSLVLIAVLSLGYSKAQIQVFHEDFANGIPSSWYNKGTAGNGLPSSWVQWKYTHEGSQGAYDEYPKQDTIISPTAYNGWIIFDSDSLDNGGHTLSNGQPNTAGGPANAPQSPILAIPGIDVSTTPFCRMVFNQYFRDFQSVTMVALSYDSGGASGTDWVYDTLNSSIAVNAATAQNSQITLDLSSVIQANPGGPNKIYIQFLMNANYYFWQIDDINITSLPNNDLEIVQTETENQSGTSGLGLFYAQIPLTQTIDSFITVVTYENTGADPQPNDVATITEFKAPLGTTNFTQINTYSTNPPVALLPYATDTFDVGEFSDNALGTYLMAVSVHSDSTNYDPGINVDTLEFFVTDSVYTINLNPYVQSGIYILRSDYGLSTQNGMLFEIDQTDTVTSITSAFDGGLNNTQPGAVVGANIYPVTVSSTGISLGGSQVNTIPRTLQAADLTAQTAGTITPVTMLMDYSSGSPVLTPGVYLAVITPISTPDSFISMPTTAIQQGGSNADLEIDGGTLYWQGADGVYCTVNFGHPSSILYGEWTRNPGTSPLKVGQTVTFHGTTNGNSSTVYNWTLVDSSAGAQAVGGYSLSPETGASFSTAFDTIYNSHEDSFYVCLTVTDQGYTSTPVCKYVEVAYPSGITEVSPLSQLSMVPNPTTGLVTISASNVNGNVNTTVMDLLGNVVKNYTDESNGSFSKKYDLSSLTSGMYIVKIENAGTIVTKKLSISKL